MDKLTEVVINYIEMKSTGALLITGDWGSGKTFHLKNKVFKKIEQETGRTPIIISLFGESTKANLAQKMMFAYLDSKVGKLSTSILTKNLKQILDSIPKIKEWIDFEKLLTTGESLFKVLPHDKLVLVFDDLERMSNELHVDDFLGLINDLVERDGSKVLLIANETEMDVISYKEKVIEKTFYFTPNLEDVFNSLIKSYDKSLFREFVIDHKEFFLNSIDTSAINNAQLKKSYSNIRTLKFALEHFRVVFEEFPQKPEHFTEKLVITQLEIPPNVTTSFRGKVTTESYVTYCS